MKPIISVHVDKRRCTGHTLCLFEAPNIFAFNKNEDLAFVKPDAENHFVLDIEDIYRAALVCPMDAILINGKAPQR